METANPYLNLDGNAEEVFEFYSAVLDVDYLDFLRFRDMGDSMGIPEEELDKIAHVALPLGDSLLMGGDSVEGTGQSPSAGDSHLIRLEPESGEEADQLFEALSEGGQVLMDLQEVAWAEKHGWCVDKFGIQWIVDLPGDVEQAG